MKISPTLTKRLWQWLAVGVAAILVLLPLHALFTTWLGSSFGHPDVFKIWKELVITVLSVVALALVLRDRSMRRTIFTHRLILLMISYGLLFMVTGGLALMAGRVNVPALIYGELEGLRYLVFFILAAIVASQAPWLRTNTWKLLVAPAVVVLMFGLLQHFVLPADVLRHAGYSPQTIPAYQLVDLKDQYVRIQSTLRGPNPLGAYLVLVITAIAGGWLYIKGRRTWLGLLAAAAFIVLFFTYSRSALVATLVSIAILLWLSIRSRLWRLWVLAILLPVVLLLGSLFLVFRHNSEFQNVIFHTDNRSRSPRSSNADRAQALKNAAYDVRLEPFGRGPGTAGPPSARNNQPARIAENYYLQIGQTVGIAGILAFVAINIWVGWLLWQQRTDPMALILLASLVGISLVNLVSHAWADDTLGLLWWGLAGIVCTESVTGILSANQVRTKYEKAPQKAKTRSRPRR